MRTLKKASLLLILISSGFLLKAQERLTVQPDGYLGTHGFDVILFNNDYAEGHQGGVELILHDDRIATNGDLRLEPTPGQWSPMPKLLRRDISGPNGKLSARLVYPDSARNRRGFNPIIYPDLNFEYDVNIEPGEGSSVIISVHLDSPLPKEWIGKIGFNLELFPEMLFGKGFLMDDKPGQFPRQPVGAMYTDVEGNLQAPVITNGKKLVVAPESELMRFSIENMNGSLDLLDGRFNHYNGWFVVRSLVPEGATKNAIQWKVTPSVNKKWRREPVIQVSQLGYHPNETKRAIIESDTLLSFNSSIELMQVVSDGPDKKILAEQAKPWGNFLRYEYATLDFTSITTEGLYYVQYGDLKSNTFRIHNNIHNDQTWQQTLEYFLPVQMCHMKVQEKYRTWHGACHLDDALMAPTDTNHFDGYLQGPETLTDFEPMEIVPGLNSGGWHDAGDYDLRVESQAGTVYKLALIYELFEIEYDQTMIDQTNKEVEIHVPDGKPDVLQQIEHGLLTILGGYDNLGRLYRGIISNHIRQYVHLGDAATMTDNLPESGLNDEGGFDDRWVFTENNPWRALGVIPSLASASRTLKEYNPELSKHSLEVAESLFDEYTDSDRPLAGPAINAAVELYLTTNDEKYLDKLRSSSESILRGVNRSGWSVARVIEQIYSEEFTSAFETNLSDYAKNLNQELGENPYGVPYNPAIWGAGWNIEAYGVNQYLLHQSYPDLFPKENFINALQYVLGVHQGKNTMSYVSGVGSYSATTAYGTNRADWSYIPGGVISGTGLIRPNLPELKHWPFFWQQTEYVIGGAATNFMLLSLGADQVLNKK